MQMPDPLRLLDRIANWWINRHLDRREFKLVSERRDVDMSEITPGVLLFCNEAVIVSSVLEESNRITFSLTPLPNRYLDDFRLVIQWDFGLSPAIKAEKLSRELVELRSIASMLYLRLAGKCMGCRNEYPIGEDGYHYAVKDGAPRMCRLEAEERDILELYRGYLNRERGNNGKD